MAKTYLVKEVIIIGNGAPLHLAEQWGLPCVWQLRITFDAPFLKQNYPGQEAIIEWSRSGVPHRLHAPASSVIYDPVIGPDGKPVEYKGV